LPRYVRIGGHDLPGWIAGHHSPSGDSRENDATGSDDHVIADRNPGHDDRSSADEHSASDPNALYARIAEKVHRRCIVRKQAHTWSYGHVIAHLYEVTPSQVEYTSRTDMRARPDAHAKRSELVGCSLSAKSQHESAKCLKHVPTV
jgi:hypothetical protein